MSFRWSEYVTLAETLYDQAAEIGPSDEACFRAAISRAYYGVFCLARNKARRDRAAVRLTKTARDHQLVQQYFLASRDRRQVKIGLALNRLRDFRNKADYDETVAGLSPLTAYTLKTAQRLAAELDSL